MLPGLIVMDRTSRKLTPWYPQQDSNLCLGLRRATLYPLSYADVCTVAVSVGCLVSPREPQLVCRRALRHNVH